MNINSLSMNTTVHTDGRIIWVTRGEECAVRIENIDKLMQYPDLTKIHCTILSQTSKYLDVVIDEPYSEEELVRLTKEAVQSVNEKIQRLNDGIYEKTEMTKEEILKDVCVETNGKKIWINTGKGCAVRIADVDKLMQSPDFTEMDCILDQNANFVQIYIGYTMNT
ncbi:hypothetical protein [Methanolobus bombayensis]|uniref:hypothetical protein n=1 Tax=Methanolobus bombayensis TaxID=38023 RepID=UPI001AE27CA9|nr:hypothetical protein [Methanolobus bombayensis]MBP1908280.1 hypothetical protein [Methanolobus bombayensis]